EGAKHTKTEILYLGDCLEVMKDLEDKSIDMVLTDLPYGITDCKWDSIIDLDRMWDHLNRLCTGTIVLFGMEPFSSRLRLSNNVLYKYDWIWVKNRKTGYLNAKLRPMTNI